MNKILIVKKYMNILVYLYLIQFFIAIILYCFYNKSSSLFLLSNKISPNAIYVFGNSHPECAIDDKIYDGKYINLSSSGEPMFYTVSKVRKILKQGLVDTVVIEYGNFIFNSKDYIIGDNHFLNNFHRHLGLLSLRDLYFLFEQNPTKFIKGVLGINILNFYRYRKLNGGYLRLFRIFEHNKHVSSSNDSSYSFSQPDQTNFNSLTRLLKSYPNVYFIIIRCPVHKSDTSGFEVFYQNGKRQLEEFNNVKYFDFRNLPFNDSLYADDEHLNSNGARIFTKILNDSLQKFIEYEKGN
jgi:hypothetical protein